MNLFEQQCIINLALEKTQDREKRIGLAKTKEFLVHSAWKKPMILVVSLWIPYWEGKLECVNNATRL